MKQRILLTTDSFGNEIPEAILISKGGLLHLWKVECYSSQDLGLGNCRCVNHPMAIETPISTSEVVSRFGKEALDGFEEPGREQLIFDAFGVEADELETYLKVSYMLGINPLPAMRKLTGSPIVFSEDPNLLVFPDEDPGTLIFIVNSRGKISVRKGGEK